MKIVYLPAAKLILIFLFQIILLSVNLTSREINDFKLIEAPIPELMDVFSRICDVPIICDESVCGNVSYYFPGGDPEKALALFLAKNRLYVSANDDYRKVSRVKITGTAESLTLECDEVSPDFLIKELARHTGVGIVHNTLFSELITLHVRNQPLSSLLAMIAGKDPALSVSKTGEYYRFYEKSAASSPSSELNGSLEYREGKYTLTTGREYLSHLFKAIFKAQNRETVFLNRTDPVIDALDLHNRTLNELCAFLLDSSQLKMIESNGICYLYDSSDSLPDKLFMADSFTPLHCDAASLLSLVPAKMNTNKIIKLDKTTNRLHLYGIPNEVIPLKAFLEELDQETRQNEFHKLSLKYTKADAFLASCPQYLKEKEVLICPDGMSLLVDASREEIREWEILIRQMDTPEGGFPVKLKYIRTDDLLNSLPCSVTEEQIRKTGDVSLFFFKGTDAELKVLRQELLEIDHPPEQIRYELLIIQQQEGAKRDWNLDLSNSISEPGTRNAYLGQLGNLLSLNFDIASVFGYQFALELNASLGNSEARILADTSLNGMTGEAISFQNTHTYRYRDSPKTSESEKQVTGITREISSGLFLDLKGWISGDGMISMTIEAVVSKQEAVSGNDEQGALPPTSEKIIKTHIRTPVGEPVIIGGLIQQESSESIQKVPLLGEIPLLGRLFQSRKTITENTEMSLYIIPHIETELHEDESSGVTRIYERFKGDLYQ